MTKTSEELAAEEAALEQSVSKKPNEEEVRSKVIEEYGFDPDVDQERIDKLVSKEIEQHDRLFAAVGAKIKYRTEAETLRNDPRLKITTTPPENKSSEDIGKVVVQELEKRDLEGLEYSDELKKEIQRISQVQGVSIKQAARDPYIAFKISEYEKEQQAEEATISRTHRTGGTRKFDATIPPDVDQSTEEGRKTYDEWKAYARKQEA